MNWNGYLCDWKNDAKSVQWFSFLNNSQNRWATNLLQEDQSLNHSVICYWFLSLMKVRLIDWLTECVNQRIKVSTNTWMDKRCSFYAVNNNHKIIITNWHFATRILYIHHSFVQSFAFVFISWMHDWGIESMPILYAIIYPSPTNNMTNNNSNNNEIGYENGHQYRWLIIWKWKWMWNQCLEQKGKWNEEQQRQQYVNKRGHEFCFKSLRCQFNAVSDIK